MIAWTAIYLSYVANTYRDVASVHFTYTQGGHLLKQLRRLVLPIQIRKTQSHHEFVKALVEYMRGKEDRREREEGETEEGER